MGAEAADNDPEVDAGHERSEEEDKLAVYSGSTDSHGRPHGRGTETYASGTRFEGRFQAGAKSGAGCWYFADGATLRGTFQEDALQGRGVYAHPDGAATRGTYVDGELHGVADEIDPDGFVAARGPYRHGVPTGEWTVYFHDGGRLVGPVDGHAGVISGQAAYHFPDDTELRGIWKDGRMVRARYVPGSTPLTTRVDLTQECSLDVSSATCISSNPLVPDPYEQQRVYVAPSTLANAGEGLFARRPLCKGEVVAFYNGVRVRPAVVDNRDWALNGNTITLGDDWVLDVPAPWDSTAHYVASLGHKANHAFDNNAEYELYDHPRFGQIKCLRTRRAIATGEEVTVSYGYEDNLPPDVDPDAPELEAPDWYRSLLRQWRLRQS